MVIKTSLQIKHGDMEDLALILYLSAPLIQMLSVMVVGYGMLSQFLTMVVCYLPVVYLLVTNVTRSIKLDFLVLFLLVGTFFFLTYCVHPEYGEYFVREQYGIWDYIFQPTKGLYAYLFLRLVNDPERILKCMKISGWLMMVYFGYRILQYLQRGYWYGVQGSNGEAKMSYSVSFGYEVLIYATLFLYCALRYRTILDIAATAITIGMILIGGSRGPIIFLGVLVVLYFLTELKKSKKKAAVVSAAVILIAVLVKWYYQILTAVSGLMGRFGFSSRFIDKMLADDITNDSGREGIWRAAVNMIRENPLGYGAYGARPTIVRHIIAGYPHNVVLEMLIEFGVVIGTVLLLLFFGGSVLMIFRDDLKEWRPVFIPTFAATCALMVSLTFWGYRPFWMCLGLFACCIVRKREGQELTPEYLLSLLGGKKDERTGLKL